MRAPHSALGAAAISGGALFLAYLATLAPTVTLWDSGEFLAAIATLGIPHPPATPLFVFAGKAWSIAAGALPLALAVNAMSALSAAVAAGGFAWLLTRWTGRPLAGVVAALVGGSTATYWQSATETEVYAHASLAVVLAFMAAEWASTHWSARHRLLVAFIFGLAVPLHISVLVAGPAVLLLAATDAGGHVSLRAMLSPAAAWCAAVSMGTVSLAPLVGALALAGAATLAPPGDSERADVRARWEPLLALLLALLGASFVLVMLVRAVHDPGVNEGNPVTVQSLVDIVARRQYDVPPLWPRRAPFWLQLGNVVQYADWQVAAGLSDAPGPSPWRTPLTLLFVLLGIVGSVWHRQRDLRGWRVLALLLVCAVLGVVAVLNLRAGPSYGWGILPADAPHEARERDYFFALAFLVAGLWSGCGIVALAERWRGGRRRAALLLAGIPLVCNWPAVDRRRLPDAQLATGIARALLSELPPEAVLVLAGDNDTFPVWYAQHAERRRPDVTTVTVPLLGAGWYRAELGRRHALLADSVAGTWRGLSATLGAIGEAAVSHGRPIFVAASVLAANRAAVRPGAGWVLRGMWYTPASDVTPPTGFPVSIDTAAVTRRGGPWSRRDRYDGSDEVRPARDPAGRYVSQLLDCPRVAWARVSGRDAGRTGLLESVCNFR